MDQHRQIHVWISESDYLMLREQSEVTRESVSTLIRRLIKSERRRLDVREPDPRYIRAQSECGRLFNTIQP